jgi:hypothetical protein
MTVSRRVLTRTVVALTAARAAPTIPRSMPGGIYLASTPTGDDLISYQMFHDPSTYGDVLMWSFLSRFRQLPGRPVIETLR